MLQTITRFAPSPTGDLHLGHAYSARVAWREAQKNGRFILRVEDIDLARCHPHFTENNLEDLRWLGLQWDGDVRVQSEHLSFYDAGLQRLNRRGLLYPCFCTRREIREAFAQAGGVPHGPLGPIYPGICRGLSIAAREERKAKGVPFALRLDVARACEEVGPLSWIERDQGEVEARPLLAGDVVLARKDISTSYHLAVTLDDDLQEITLITRGEDLFPSTHVHRLLQALLGLRVPEYQHHPLLKSEDGERFAKRKKSLSLRALRAQGESPDDIWRRVDSLFLKVSK